MKNTQPTPAAVQTAYNNALRDGARYKLNDLLAPTWLVVKEDGSSYVVENGTCECIQNHHAGICKHVAMVEMEEQIREGERLREWA